MDYGNKVSVGGVGQTFYSNLDSVHYPVTTLLSSSKLSQNLKETTRCILRHDSPSRILRRAAKTRCMKELEKSCLHILPARAEKDLWYLHLRAQQRSEQKVLGHLLKQTEVRFKAGNRWELRENSQKILGATPCSGYTLLTPSKLATPLGCSFSSCFNVILVV